MHCIPLGPIFFLELDFRISTGGTLRRGSILAESSPLPAPLSITNAYHRWLECVSRPFFRLWWHANSCFAVSSNSSGGRLRRNECDYPVGWWLHRKWLGREYNGALIFST